MKIAELLNEMPVNLNKDAPFVFSIDGTYMSNGALKRDFDFLGELTLDKTVYKFWLSKILNRAVVTTVAENHPELKDGKGDPTNLIVVDLHLKNNEIVDIQRGLQVDTVSVNSKYKNSGFAGILYVVIARYGYNIISDFDQYNGGVGLWKKIARLSIVRKYAVRIWDITNQTWVKDSNGNILVYDETNLPDDEVWSSVGQHPKTLLVVSSKQ
jgi:hypothetical protein